MTTATTKIQAGKIAIPGIASATSRSKIAHRRPKIRKRLQSQCSNVQHPFQRQRQRSEKPQRIRRHSYRDSQRQPPAAKPRPMGRNDLNRCDRQALPSPPERAEQYPYCCSSLSLNPRLFYSGAFRSNARIAMFSANSKSIRRRTPATIHAPQTPGTNSDANFSMIALIKNQNMPNVTIVSGNVMISLEEIPVSRSPDRLLPFPRSAQ